MSSSNPSNNIHLVLFTEEFYPNTSGGAHERWTFSQKAVENGETVTVFTMRDAGTSKSETVDGVNIIRPVSGSPSFIPVHSILSLPFRIVSSFLIFLFAVIWFVRNDVDAILSTNHTFHWVVKIISTIYKIPMINYMAYTPSIRTDNSQGVKRLLEHINFKFFMGETVYCRAPRVREAIKKAGQQDVRIIHGIINSEDVYAVSEVDSAETRSKYDIAENDILVIFVGRFVPIKRPSTAIEVCQLLPENYRLLMIGDGPERTRMENKIQSSNHSVPPILTGQLPHEETLELIKASDILLMTSDAEAYPTVVIEALALGSGVVAPPVGVLPSITDSNLHIAPIDEQPETFQRLEHGSYTIREDIVSEYSMDRFTEEILTRSRELACAD